MSVFFPQRFNFRIFNNRKCSSHLKILIPVVSKLLTHQDNWDVRGLPTLSQKWSWVSVYRNWACHGWSGCNAEYVRLLFIHIQYKYIWHRNQIYNSASAPTVTGSVFMRRIRLFLGQCIAFPPSSMRLTHGEGPFAPPPRLVCLGDRTGSAYNSVLSSGVALLELE